MWIVQQTSKPYAQLHALRVGYGKHYEDYYDYDDDDSDSDDAKAYRDDNHSDADDN